MNLKGKSNILFLFRHHRIARVFFYFNLLNILNLSVNFYEGDKSAFGKQLVDPIDTLGELVYEWALDGDCDLIPDNSTEQEDKSLKKGDWKIIYQDFPMYSFGLPEKLKLWPRKSVHLVAIPHLPPTPPPDLG